jgi:hypothetical protein
MTINDLGRQHKDTPQQLLCLGIWLGTCGKLKFVVQIDNQQNQTVTQRFTYSIYYTVYAYTYNNYLN